MNHLLPCPGCQRHVRAFESACPFCRGALDLSGVPDHPMPKRRLTRAALFTFGAALAMFGCGEDDASKSSQFTDGSGGSGIDASSGGAGSPIYGCAPVFPGCGPDAGAGGAAGEAGAGGVAGGAGVAGASGASGTAGAAGGDASTAGAYGLPPDAG